MSRETPASTHDALYARGIVLVLLFLMASFYLLVGVDVSQTEAQSAPAPQGTIDVGRQR